MAWDKLIDDDLYNSELDEAKRYALVQKRTAEIKATKNKYKKSIETNKVIAIYLFTMLNILIAFSMIAMWHFADLSYLGVLITDIAAQILLYGIYCLKAYHGKKQEEHMKFRREQALTGQPPLGDDEALG